MALSLWPKFPPLKIHLWADSSQKDGGGEAGDVEGLSNKEERSHGKGQQCGDCGGRGGGRGKRVCSEGNLLLYDNHIPLEC